MSVSDPSVDSQHRIDVHLKIELNTNSAESTLPTPLSATPITTFSLQTASTTQSLEIADRIKEHARNKMLIDNNNNQSNSPILPPIHEKEKDSIFKDMLGRVANTYKTALERTVEAKEDSDTPVHASHISPPDLAASSTVEVASSGTHVLETTTKEANASTNILKSIESTSDHSSIKPEEVGTFINEGDSDYVVKIRQQPKLVRCSAMADRGGERKPVEPVPILQISFHGQTNGQDPKTHYFPYPFFFLHASLIHGITGADENTLGESGERSMVGTVASSVYRLKDLDQSIGGFFIFPELAIRKPGKFRFKFILFELINSPNSPSQAVRRGQIISDIFEVSDSFDFVGTYEITPLSRSFAEQGIRLRIPKSAWSSIKKNEKKKETDEKEMDIDERPEHENTQQDQYPESERYHDNASRRMSLYSSTQPRLNPYYYQYPNSVPRRSSDTTMHLQSHYRYANHPHGYPPRSSQHYQQIYPTGVPYTQQTILPQGYNHPHSLQPSGFNHHQQPPQRRASEFGNQSSHSGYGHSQPSVRPAYFRVRQGQTEYVMRSHPQSTSDQIGRRASITTSPYVPPSQSNLSSRYEYTQPPSVLASPPNAQSYPHAVYPSQEYTRPRTGAQYPAYTISDRRASLPALGTSHRYNPGHYPGPQSFGVNAAHHIQQESSQSSQPVDITTGALSTPTSTTNYQSIEPSQGPSIPPTAPYPMMPHDQNGYPYQHYRPSMNYR